MYLKCTPGGGSCSARRKPVCGTAETEADNIGLLGVCSPCKGASGDKTAVGDGTVKGTCHVSVHRCQPDGSCT